MTQEDKELLLIDLSTRLPYGFTIHRYSDNCDIAIESNGIDEFAHFLEYSEGEDFKPYLRPMRSITEEEIKELSEIDMKRVIFSSRHLTWHLDGEIIDYLNKKMLDWRGLIPRGLALEAPEGMYN
jgi:hypothetical protein